MTGGKASVTAVLVPGLPLSANVIDGTAVTHVSRVTMRNRELIATSRKPSRKAIRRRAHHTFRGGRRWSDTLAADVR